MQWLCMQYSVDSMKLMVKNSNPCVCNQYACTKSIMETDQARGE